VARKKDKLPLREGTKLPPMTEEERLSRRTQNHPLDDFPLTPRPAKWREVEGENAAEKQFIEHKIISSTDRSVERSVDSLTKRSTERSEDKQAKEAYIALDATHTASEAKVYGYLYRLSLTKGQAVCRASLTELQDSLGLSKNTIIKAVRGLTEKLSIDVLERRAGSGIGSLYHVYPVKEILARRKDAGIEIDDYKRIALKGSVERSIERLIERAKIERSMVQNLNVQLNVQPEVISLTEHNLPTSPEKTKNFIIRNDDDLRKSSSIGDDDDFARMRIQQIYCDLTGNTWRPQDEEEVKTIDQIPLGHIIMGICYSLDRATGHQINSLKYCIPSILDHYEDMKCFPESDLMGIAYNHMMKIKQALKNKKQEE